MKRDVSDFLAPLEHVIWWYFERATCRDTDLRSAGLRVQQELGLYHCIKLLPSCFAAWYLIHDIELETNHATCDLAGKMVMNKHTSYPCSWSAIEEWNEMYLTFLHHWSMWFGGILNVQLAETQTCEALAWECSKNWAYTTVSSYCHLVLRLDTWYMTLNLRQTMWHVIWLARWWWTNTQVIHVADQLLKSETRCIWLSCTIGACDLAVFWTCNQCRNL